MAKHKSGELRCPATALIFINVFSMNDILSHYSHYSTTMSSSFRTLLFINSCGSLSVSIVFAFVFAVAILGVSISRTLTGFALSGGGGGGSGQFVPPLGLAGSSAFDPVDSEGLLPIMLYDFFLYRLVKGVNPSFIGLHVLCLHLSTSTLKYETQMLKKSKQINTSNAKQKM